MFLNTLLLVMEHFTQRFVCYTQILSEVCIMLNEEFLHKSFWEQLELEQWTLTNTTRIICTVNQQMRITHWEVHIIIFLMEAYGSVREDSSVCILRMYKSFCLNLCCLKGLNYFSKLYPSKAFLIFKKTLLINS